MNAAAAKWVTPTLDQACEINPRDPSPQSQMSLVSFVPMAAVSDTEGVVLEHATRPFSEVAKGYTRFREQDVIFAKITPCMENGKIAVADGLHDGIACGSTEFHVLRSRGSVMPKYLWYFLRQKTFRVEAERHMAGAVGQRRVPVSYLRQVRIPLPVVAVQERMVSKIDGLLGHSKIARNELERIPRLVERYKQALLKLAFDGKLTTDWRLRSQVSMDEWHSKPLGTIADIGTGATPKRGHSLYYKDGTIPWVTSGAVNQPRVTAAEEFITEAALRETNCKVFPVGTLLMAMYGEGQTRGRIAVLDIAAATNQALAAIRVRNETEISTSFVLWFLRANYLELRMRAAGGVQPNLNLSIIKSIVIPVPPPEEQLEIVRRIEQSIGHVESLLNEAVRASTLVNRLDEATLAKAFKGELPVA